MTGRLCLGLQTSAHYFLAEASSEWFRKTNTVHQRQPGIYSAPERLRKKLVQGVYVGLTCSTMPSVTLQCVYMCISNYKQCSVHMKSKVCLNCLRNWQLNGLIIKMYDDVYRTVHIFSILQCGKQFNIPTSNTFMSLFKHYSYIMLR